MIRPARPSDVPEIALMIRELAEYEHLTHEVSLDEDRLRDHLFGSPAFAQVLVAEIEAATDSHSSIVGFALYFFNYSTFLGLPGIYLEDLFVRPAHRGQGFGKQLLTTLAQIAVDRGFGRLEWSVLDWNTPSIAFYKKLGAKPMKEWTMYRLTGDALRTVGVSSRPPLA